MSVTRLTILPEVVNQAALDACADAAAALRSGEASEFVAVLFRPDGSYRTYGINARLSRHRFMGIMQEAIYDAAAAGKASA